MLKLFFFHPFLYQNLILLKKLLNLLILFLKAKDILLESGSLKMMWFLHWFIPSKLGTAEYSSLSDLRRAECEDSLSSGSRLEERSFSPGEARPTLASLVEADLAVAQAVQNLQDLKVRCLRSVELDAGFCILKKIELLCKKKVERLPAKKETVV